MIDFHCHIDLYPDPYAVLKQAEQKGMTIISVTTTPSAWQITQALPTVKQTVETALGLHPQLAHERSHELGLFDELVKRVVIVGEIGLDGGKEYLNYTSTQKNVFGHILQSCTQAGGRILSIHCRRASNQVLDMLRDHPDAGIPVIHWFSGTMQSMQRAIDQGCWFSVGPAMLQGRQGQNLVANMPRNRVLTETDGPFAQIMQKPAMPWDVMYAVNSLSSLWNTDTLSVLTQIKFNMSELYRKAGCEPIEEK